MTQTQPEETQRTTLTEHYQQKHQDRRYEEETQDQPSVPDNNSNNPPVIEAIASKKSEKVRITGEDMELRMVLFTATIF